MKSVAENKKKQNSSEYIIYMYQMEDLIRSYSFNMDEIEQYVISHYPVPNEQKKDISGWFGSLAERMKAEGIEKGGHLSEVQKEVDTLAKIHWSLLKEDGEYFKIYDQAKPHLLDFIGSAEGDNLGHEIQICINGVYGLLLCRLTGKKVSSELQQAAEAFGGALSYLSVVYQEREK